MKIISTGGTTNGTRVYNDDGSEIKNVTRIVIEPMGLNEMVTATITVAAVELDIEAAEHGE